MGLSASCLNLTLVPPLLPVPHKADSQVVLVAATNRPDVVDRALRRPGRFDREVEVGVPSPADRRDILNALLAGMRHTLTEHEVMRGALLGAANPALVVAYLEGASPATH